MKKLLVLLCILFLVGFAAEAPEEKAEEIIKREIVPVYVGEKLE